jgi:hypothetical protein
MLQAEIEPLSRKTGSNQSASKTAQGFDGFVAKAKDLFTPSYTPQPRLYAFA